MTAADVPVARVPNIYERLDPKLVEAIRNMSDEEIQQLLNVITPRIVEPYTRHIPHPVQQHALTFMCEELMFGGAGGGGKSDWLLMAALQFVDVPGYSGLILRKTWPDLNAPNAILDRAKQWFDGLDVKKRDEGRQWFFPSGARLQFGSLQFDQDKAKYQSAEYQFIGFDELTHWDRDTYLYMFSRLRGPEINCLTCATPLAAVRQKQSKGFRYIHKNAGFEDQCELTFPDPKVIAQYPPARDGTSIFDVPLRMRSATNPGSQGHRWVKERFVDPMTRNPDAVFVKSLISDNPSIGQDQYVKMLMHLAPIDRERMLNGDWDVEIEGKYFKREDFRFMRNADLPHSQDMVRYWDQAATVGDSSDWTVGALVGIGEDDEWVIYDIERFQDHPHEVERRILATAQNDGWDIPIRMEQEPGSAGVNNIHHYRRRILAGYDFDGIRSTGKKEVRASAMASQCKGRNVLCAHAHWNVDFLDEAVLFPTEKAHDDQIDACSGGFTWLLDARRTRLIL